MGSNPGFPSYRIWIKIIIFKENSARFFILFLRLATNNSKIHFYMKNINNVNKD